MTTLITGATGKVGSRFARRMHAAGEPVRLLVRNSAAPIPAGVDIAVADLRDETGVRGALSGVTAIVHVASAFRAFSAEEMAATDIAGTDGLANAALDAGITRFVYTSTNQVYDGCDYGRPATEDDPVGTDLHPYPAAKVEVENRLRSLHHQRGLDLRIVRLPFVYGEGDPHIADAAWMLANRPSHQRLPTAHHADVSQALLRALRAEGVAGRTYNVCDDAPMTLYEIYQLHNLGLPEQAGTADQPASNFADPSPWQHTVSTARIRRELGFRPLYPTVTGAAEAGVL
ncbi:NAD-dependent epimerase/dehydratase family protein [Mycobacterium paraterrae]|uniref:NAD(P)-dependent oxidoreductase n=1 Tax=Mycobacterium paraterrae TaxID=577492 RepID=A0ABY3VNJ4_9MYCO|nr:NAD(P)-dependent oxidoreductase [Mycobacterium paraterrae]UMB70990.1 NAD(P)-dependent oxidoreductase [Mycobacterium paraterrae]